MPEGAAVGEPLRRSESRRARLLRKNAQAEQFMQLQRWHRLSKHVYALECDNDTVWRKSDSVGYLCGRRPVTLRNWRGKSGHHSKWPRAEPLAEKLPHRRLLPVIPNHPLTRE